MSRPIIEILDSFYSPKSLLAIIERCFGFLFLDFFSIALDFVELPPATLCLGTFVCVCVCENAL